MRVHDSSERGFSLGELTAVGVGETEDDEEAVLVNGMMTPSFPSIGKTMAGVPLQNPKCNKLPDWLYIHVAANTTLAPRANGNVRGKSKKATEARHEMTMLKLVANPLRMLSAYLITNAVMRPPKTWMKTVDQAQAPKLWNRSNPCSCFERS